MTETVPEQSNEAPAERPEPTREQLNDHLYIAWGVIANVGLHYGGWAHEHPQWVEAAIRWREEFHRLTGVTVDEPPAPGTEANLVTALAVVIARYYPTPHLADAELSAEDLARELVPAIRGVLGIDAATGTPA